MNQAKIKNWLQFLTVGIWRVTDEEATPLQHRIYACIKIVLLSRLSRFLVGIAI